MKKKECSHYSSDCDLLVHLTDIHTGVGSDNYFNKFNDEVLKSRLEEYLEQIFEVRDRHKAENCYLVIGEIISGLIHNTLRIEQNENVIEQFKVASTLICDFIKYLCEGFDTVHVYVTAGNHSRIISDKKDSLEGENFDYLFPFFASARLQNCGNLVIHENNIDSSVAMFSIRGML